LYFDDKGGVFPTRMCKICMLWVRFVGLEFDIMQIPEWVFYFVKDLGTLMEHHYQYDKLG